MTPDEKIAAAWKAWIESVEGRAYGDARTLGTSDPSKYLHNRLWSAFMAGAAAAAAATDTE